MATPSAAAQPIAPATNPADTTFQAPKRVQPSRLARLQWFPAPVARLIFGKPLAPSAEEWAAVQRATCEGDPLADALVEWMFAGNPGQRKKQFELALANGIDSVTDAAPELRTFFARIDNDPPWLNRELLEEGIAASHLSGKVGFYVLRDMALMGGYAYFNTMNQTLALAGALHKDTRLRLGETGKWLMDVTEPNGMSRYGPGFATTVRVRLVHALVRRHLQKSPEWSMEKWGIPINQVDMTATYLAFGPVTLSGARLFGVPVGLKESKAFMHLWRYIGWLSGVDEKWLAITERDGLRKLYHTFMTHRLPDEKIGLLGAALRDEPLTRHVPGLEDHPRLTKLVRWALYQQHLSNSSLILGPINRRRLKLPMLIFPWYPVVSAPFRFAVLNYVRLRGGKTLERYAVKSRKRQKDLLNAYFGNEEKRIIEPKADHPAHVG